MDGLPSPHRVPRNPRKGVLYRVLQATLPLFLETFEADPERILPGFVRSELEGYLGCGTPEGGFSRYRCDCCGLEELIPFSCKGRGFCPSCGGRRMSSQAAHLVDHVLPRVPIRQWVFTLPWELRALLAYNPDVLEGVKRIWWDSIAWWLNLQAKRQGLEEVHLGGVNMVQRFDSALRLNVHFHTLVLSGVYSLTPAGELVFHELPCPSKDDLALILHRITFKVVDWLVAHDHLTEDGNGVEGSPESLPGMLLAKAVAGGSAMGGKVGLQGRDPFAEVTFSLGKHAAACQGFTLYVGPSLGPEGTYRVEKICRYIARPPIATPRLHLTPKGDVVYKFKRPWKDGTHSVCLTQLAFVERLAALVPPPRRHLLTYHGVLAPNAALRARVVPAKPESLSTADPKPETPLSKSQPTPQEEEKPSRYYPWAYLLNRVFGIKPWICPRCGGPRRLIPRSPTPWW